MYNYNESFPGSELITVGSASSPEATSTTIVIEQPARIRPATVFVHPPVVVVAILSLRLLWAD